MKRLLLLLLVLLLGINPLYSQCTGLDFDGVDDIINCGNDNSTNITSSMTVECWIKPAVNLDNYKRFVERFFPQGYCFGSGVGTNELSVFLEGAERATSAPNTITPNVWQHVAFIFNDGTDEVIIYHDGNSVATGSYAGTITGTANPLTIGAYFVSTGFEFTGEMDEVRVWDVVRTPAEIQNNMGVCLTGSEPGLQAYYQFEDGTGSSILTDLTVNNNTGTLTNMDVNNDWVTNTLCVQATVTTVDSVTCNGGSDGNVDITVTGQLTPYTYIWSNSAITEDLTNVAANTYTVTVTDASGCTTVVSATVEEPTLLVVVITSTDSVDCNGGTDGDVDITATGGTTGYTYAWSNSAITEDLTNVAANTYTVTVTDNNGCTATATATVAEPAVLTTTVNNVDSTDCNGGITGSLIDITVTGGTTSYSYIWSNSATTQDLTNVSAGTYTITVTDNKGCTSTVSATVAEPAAIPITPVDMNICQADSSLLEGSWQTTAGTYYDTLQTTLGCDSVIETTLTKNDTIDPVITCPGDITSCEPVVTFTEPVGTDECPGAVTTQTDGSGLSSGSTFAVGTTTLTYEVTDLGGNKVTCSFTVTILEQVVANAGPDLTTTAGTPITIQSSITGATTFSWQPATGLDNPSSAQPTATIDQTTTYIVTATNASGCTDSDTVTIVVEIRDLIIYNLLSPNGDGLNDTWKVNKPELLDGCKVLVVNRWGSKVFRSNGYDNSWDGTSLGQRLPAGTYFYIIKCDDETHKGPLTLVR